jgi:hypothetical protein
MKVLAVSSRRLRLASRPADARANRDIVAEMKAERDGPRYGKTRIELVQNR